MTRTALRLLAFSPSLSILSLHRPPIIISLGSTCSFSPSFYIQQPALKRVKSNPQRQTSTIANNMTDYTLYYAPTPNGKKIALCLEDMNLSYNIEPIRIGKNDQFTEKFKAINPNSKIPALVDHTSGDLVVFESGAILEYLAEKTNSFLPSDTEKKYAVKQWLYWQMAGFGPMLGQFGFFWMFSKDDVPIAKDRYLKEAVRLFGVLDDQLSKNKFIAGDEYSIADMATYFWSKSPAFYKQASHFEHFENVKRWQEEIEKRPSVAKVEAIKYEW